MAKTQRWLVLNDDGSIASQVIIKGDATPEEAGDNPNGLLQIRVKRHGDLHHEHFDVQSGRWKSDTVKKERHERHMKLHFMRRDELVDYIADEVTKRVLDALKRDLTP